MTTIHQIVPVLARHDAVGSHSRRVQTALADRGHGSKIFAEIIVGDPGPDAHLIEEFEQHGADADLLLFQASTGSTAADWLRSRAEPFAVNYHNITPAAFFDRWTPEAAANMRRGRSQVRGLASRSVAGLADSAYNAAELEAMGYTNVSVAPLLLDLDQEVPARDPQTVAYLERTRRGPRWLFVGRLAPNKCQHDLLAALAVHRRLHEPEATLTLVGSPASMTYADALLQVAEQLGVDDAVTIVAGLSDAELAAHYAGADVFVCLSEHEGFCIPLLEAMRHEVPVVAFAAAAVPETAADAALLLPEKDPHLVATTVARLLADPAMRDRLVQAGRARVADHRLERTVPRFVEAVEGALAAARGLRG